MIEFKIQIQQPKNLLEEDASFSLGWFEFSVKGFTGCFFRDKYCMVLLTLGNLIEHLDALRRAQKAQERWVGEDHGATIQMTREKDVLELCVAEVVIHVPYQPFKTAVLNTAKTFMDECINLNPSIQQESAFEGLTNVFRALRVE